MQVDWDRVGQEGVALLRELLRFDTTNPPGNELALARYLEDRLKAEGFDPQILESAPNRANLVVRMNGTGRERPMLLLSHTDVVPAEPSQWTHPPFAGHVADGYVWGRGAFDSKLTVVVGIQVLRLCKRLGLPLERDLVVVAAGDEEMRATCGVRWLAEHHADVFDAEFGINEGGGYAVKVDGRPIYTCQVGEKGSAPVDLISTGRPGHSSVPHDNNAIAHLGKVLRALGERKMPHRVTKSGGAFIQGAAAAQRHPEVRALLLKLLVPEEAEAALRALPVDEPTRLMLDATLRNTCAPTMLNAGLKRNVIPSEVRLSLSGRTLPGTDEATFMEELREIVGDEIEVEMKGPFSSGNEFDHETDLFEAIRTSLKRFDPEGTVAPHLTTGGTDAKWLAHLDMQIYGFIPMRWEPGFHFYELAHGHDERISTQNVRFATQVVFDTVCRLNGCDVR